MGIEQGTPQPEASKQEQQPMITEVPLDTETRALVDAKRQAFEDSERAAAQRLVEGGRYGNGTIEVPVPADPYKAGWNGETLPEAAEKE